jgi:acetolactate synthase-1/2/3 large subunit
LTALVNPNKHREWRESFRELDAKERQKVIEPDIHPTDGPLLMGEVVNCVAGKAPRGTVLVTDVGQNQLFATRYFRYPQKRSICTSGGLGTMGYGMPAAIGATFATDRTVCCFMGDGGFQMCIEELGTIMEQQAPVKMILLNNNYLGNVRQWQDMFWMHRKAFTKMQNPCYELIAQGYGIAYQAVTKREDLVTAVEKMLQTDGPFLLECAIKENDDVLPMTPPGMNVDDMMLEV